MSSGHSVEDRTKMHVELEEQWSSCKGRWSMLATPVQDSNMMDGIIGQILASAAYITIVKARVSLEDYHGFHRASPCKSAIFLMSDAARYLTCVAGVASSIDVGLTLLCSHGIRQVHVTIISLIRLLL